jgi:hypothetical protein
MWQVVEIKMIVLAGVFVSVSNDLKNPASRGKRGRQIPRNNQSGLSLDEIPMLLAVLGIGYP